MKRLLLLSVLLLAACDPSGSPMTGKWNGPEGTWLNVMHLKDDSYAITIKNLDGELTFGATQGTSGTLYFMRNGLQETLTPGDGKATGMKWLADKKNCVVVRSGEGYCRD